MVKKYMGVERKDEHSLAVVSSQSLAKPNFWTSLKRDKLERVSHAPPECGQLCLDQEVSRDSSQLFCAQNHFDTAIPSIWIPQAIDRPSKSTRRQE